MRRSTVLTAHKESGISIAAQTKKSHHQDNTMKITKKRLLQGAIFNQLKQLQMLHFADNLLSTSL